MRRKYWLAMVAALACVHFLAGLALAAPPPQLAGTTWTLMGKGRISMQRVGNMPVVGELYLSFDEQGNVFLEDEAGYVLEGTYTCDARGKLQITIAPDTIQDFVYANLGDFIHPYTPEMLDLTFTVQTMTITGRVTSGRRGAAMTLTLNLRASVGFDIDGRVWNGQLSYRLGARGAMDN